VASVQRSYLVRRAHPSGVRMQSSEQAQPSEKHNGAAWFRPARRGRRGPRCTPAGDSPSPVDSGQPRRRRITRSRQLRLLARPSAPAPTSRGSPCRSVFCICTPTRGHVSIYTCSLFPAPAARAPPLHTHTNGPNSCKHVPVANGFHYNIQIPDLLLQHRDKLNICNILLK
jgi:hypothetical protein